VWAFIRWSERENDEAPVVKTPKARNRATRRPASELEQVPGIGPSIAADLQGIGVRRVDQLKGADPTRLYERVCEKTGVRQDRCLLYVFRCAVYYASRPVHEPEKLKWWNWKDGR
jgi:hypothetical protein